MIIVTGKILLKLQTGLQMSYQSITTCNFLAKMFFTHGKESSIMAVLHIACLYIIFTCKQSACMLLERGCM